MLSEVEESEGKKEGENQHSALNQLLCYRVNTVMYQFAKK
jgi:hypothetical protein